MTRAELDKRLEKFRVDILKEFDDKETETPAEAALKRMEGLPGFSQHSNRDDSKWMFREGVRQFRKAVSEHPLVRSHMDDIEKELLA